MFSAGTAQFHVHPRARSFERIHQTDQLGAAPFDFEAMAACHFLQIITDGAAGGGKRKRLFDFARYPFLAVNQEFQLLRQCSCGCDFGGKGSNTLGRNAARASYQVFQFTHGRAFVFARSGKKMFQFVIFDLSSKAVERNYASPLRLQQ
jgi:hypothetical protein